MKKDYTREELLDICERAFVPQIDWHDRDSASSQIKVGTAYALLKAGCEFEILFADDGKGCSTNEDTIWVQFYVHDFMWFECGSDDSDNKMGNGDFDYHVYLPTVKRLEEAKGKDWY